MDAKGYCNYAHTDRFGRSDKDSERRKGGADARVNEKRPNEESGGGMGENKQCQGEGTGSATNGANGGLGGPAVGNKEEHGRGGDRSTRVGAYR